MTSDELPRAFGLSKIEKKLSAVSDDYSVTQNWMNEPQKDGKRIQYEDLVEGWAFWASLLFIFSPS